MNSALDERINTINRVESIMCFTWLLVAVFLAVADEVYRLLDKCIYWEQIKHTAWTVTLEPVETEPEAIADVEDFCQI